VAVYDEWCADSRPARQIESVLEVRDALLGLGDVLARGGLGTELRRESATVAPSTTTTKSNICQLFLMGSSITVSPLEFVPAKQQDVQQIRVH